MTLAHSTTAAPELSMQLSIVYNEVSVRSIAASNLSIMTDL
jgi:hypothetical protein